MRLSRLSVSACAFAAFVLAGVAIGSGQAPAPQTQKPAQPPRPPLLHAGNLIMPPDDAIAANGGPVFGSANQTGFYITRNVFRNNNTSRPHYHTMDRWVTVIKGTWWGGTGKVFRPKEMKPMPAGISTPSLAESWTMAKDNVTYEFVLRIGIKFHNGDPVTAEDVKFSFERYTGPRVAEPAAGLIQGYPYVGPCKDVKLT